MKTLKFVPKATIENVAKLLLINDLLQLPGSLFLGHETYDDLVGLESRNVSYAHYSDIKIFSSGNSKVYAFESGVVSEDSFGDTDNRFTYIVGVSTDSEGGRGIRCNSTATNSVNLLINGNNTVLGGFLGSISGNECTFKGVNDSWAAQGYKEIYFGYESLVKGGTQTTSHIIGGLSRGYNWGNDAWGFFYGSNTFHGDIFTTGGASVANLGALILPGVANLQLDSWRIKNLAPGNFNYSRNWIANYAYPSLIDTSAPGGRCIGGGYTEINGGSLKVTSPGYFEARVENGANGAIPAGKYAWPLRYKSGTCDIGISTSGKLRSLFGGAAVGRRITDMGRLVIYLLSGTSGDLQSYWVDKGPYGGWYLFDPGYWRLVRKFSELMQKNSGVLILFS